MDLYLFREHPPLTPENVNEGAGRKGSGFVNNNSNSNSNSGKYCPPLAPNGQPYQSGPYSDNMYRAMDSK